MPLTRRNLTRMLAALALLCGGTPLFTSACKIAPTEGSDRQQVLRDLVSNVIVPTYTDLASSTAALAQAVSALASPTAEALASAQAAYRAARVHQKSSEAFLYGPADDLLITGGALDSWPPDGAKLDALLADVTPLDAVLIGRLGANQRGFPGLEWLLFDSATRDAVVLDAFGSSPRRGALAALLAQDLAATCQRVAAAFEGPSGFGVQLAEAGLTSTRFATQAEGVDEVVTGLLYVTELMVMKKFAGPLGIDVGGAPRPALEEGPRSDSSVADLRADVAGIRAIFSGTRGARAGQGLVVPVRARNEGAASRFEALLADADAKLAAIQPSFRVALTQNRAAIEAAYQATRALKTAIQTEIAGALGANIGFGFSDTD
ncbi:MAG: imelysin family protein [Polyangiales bacterium]